MDRAWLYMLTNRPGGVLYLGLCNANLVRRIWQHRNGHGSAFTRRYGCHQLVWFESMPDVTAAAEQERRMKRWKRAWKVAQIEAQNPQWRDLYPDIAG